jgi:hypothetical protein
VPTLALCCSDIPVDLLLLLNYVLNKKDQPMRVNGVLRAFETVRNSFIITE